MNNIGSFLCIGDAWINLCNKIITEGIRVKSHEEEYTELKRIAFSVSSNNTNDIILSKYADNNIIQWMRNNFECLKQIEEFNNSNSYAERLYKYGNCKNQIEWVIKRINNQKKVRSATITTFEPLTDISYIPCISLIDFDVNEDVLDIIIYARALDFGGKAYANMICLYDLLEKVAKKTNCIIGKMYFICKSVHIYNTDYNRITNMLVQERNHLEQAN